MAFNFVDDVISCALKVFVNECGDGPYFPYFCQAEKDFYKTCMNVASEVVSRFCSSVYIDYFDSRSESLYNEFFGGKESE